MTGALLSWIYQGICMDAGVIVIGALFASSFVQFVQGQDPIHVFCDQSYLGHFSTGAMYSPNFPFDYWRGKRCTHRIHLHTSAAAVSEGKVQVVCFTALRFKLSSDNCEDYLEMDGNVFCHNGKLGHHPWEFRELRMDGETFRVKNIWDGTICVAPVENVVKLEFNSGDHSSRGFYLAYTIHHVSSAHAQKLVQGNTTHAEYARCKDDEFTCFNRQCITHGLVCDGRHNCADNSDEDYTHARCPGGVDISGCDFESELHPTCGFMTTNLNWRRTKQTTGGPRYDHTVGSLKGPGHFLYTSYIVGHPSVAHLDYPRPLHSRSFVRCLTFWYFMSNQVGVLWLGFMMSPTGNYTRVWFRQDDQGRQWQRADVELPPSYPPIYEVRFGSERGADEHSNIALDDISIVDKPCYGRDISCTFEISECSWSNDAAASLRWKRWSGSTLSRDTGPYTDRHGDPDGHYIYMDAKAAFPGEESVGRLVSRGVSASAEPHCLTFWYHAFGRDIQGLYVMVRNASGVSERKWSSNIRRQRNVWREGLIPFAVRGPFQVVFEGFSTGINGDLALDDIVLRFGACYPPQPPTTPQVPSIIPCGTGEFQCGSGECILFAYVCDGRFDCSDHSDETDCANSLHVHRIIVGAVCVITMLIIASVLAIFLWIRKYRTHFAAARQSTHSFNVDGGSAVFGEGRPSRVGVPPPPYTAHDMCTTPSVAGLAAPHPTLRIELSWEPPPCYDFPNLPEIVLRQPTIHTVLPPEYSLNDDQLPKYSEYHSEVPSQPSQPLDSLVLTESQNVPQEQEDHQGARGSECVAPAATGATYSEPRTASTCSMRDSDSVHDAGNDVHDISSNVYATRSFDIALELRDDTNADSGAPANNGMDRNGTSPTVDERRISQPCPPLRTNLWINSDVSPRPSDGSVGSARRHEESDSTLMSSLQETEI